MPRRAALAALLLTLVFTSPASAGYPEAPAAAWLKPGLAKSFDPPSQGRLSSPFGYRWGVMHNGIDFEGWRYTAVYAPLPGRVVRYGWSTTYWGLGNTLTIRHAGGLETLYAHLASVRVKRGDWVTAGQLIARAGCTGSCTGVHLHFETRVNGRFVDPMRFLKGRLGVR